MRAGLVALLVCSGCRALRRSNPPPRDGELEHYVEVDDASARSAYDVPFALGDAEFHDGDAIEITRLLGTRPALELGGRYRVSGRYTLASADRAGLLFSVTVTRGSGRGAVPAGALMRVERGSGNFELTLPLVAPGYPHLTLYGEDGRPLSGVYFGDGEWLLERKDWRYRGGVVNENDRLELSAWR